MGKERIPRRQISERLPLGTYECTAAERLKAAIIRHRSCKTTNKIARVVLAGAFALCTGCAQIGSGPGLSSAALTVPCPGGTGSATYNAPFGVVPTSIEASCLSAPGGGVIATITTNNLGSILSMLTSAGVIPASKPAPQNGGHS